MTSIFHHLILKTKTIKEKEFQDEQPHYLVI